VKLGVMLPTFRDGAEEALAVAAVAARTPLDGVFAFDHLWPMGQPQRPALAPFPVLAAIATRWPSLWVGPLVARVGLYGNDELIERFRTLETMAPGRVIAAVGTGDHLSQGEEVAYGLDDRPAADRRAMLVEVIAALAPRMTVWCGAGSPRTNELARNLGAEINLWAAAPEAVAEAASLGPVNWAGPLDGASAATLSALRDAGATWAIASSPSGIEALREWRTSH